MEITSKDYGVLFRLLRAGRCKELGGLWDEYDGYKFNWPIEVMICWYKPKLTKAEMDVEIHRIYDSEDYHEFGDLCLIAEMVHDERSRASYWCGPIYGVHTRKEFEKKCREHKVVFKIDEDLYNLFCEPKKHTKGYNSNINLRKKS
jgi:hypothetical protein